MVCFTKSSFAGTQLAQEYGDDDNILFGLMNEPHDLDMDLWGITMQKVVDAIRQETGNNNKILLLPGTNFTYASILAIATLFLSFRLILIYQIGANLP